MKIMIKINPGFAKPCLKIPEQFTMLKKMKYVMDCPA